MRDIKNRAVDMCYNIQGEEYLTINQLIIMLEDTYSGECPEHLIGAMTEGQCYHCDWQGTSTERPSLRLV